MLQDILIKWGGVEVSAMDVYTDMFKLGDHEVQCNGEEAGLYKANPIGYWKNGTAKGHYRIMFEDDFEKMLKELQEADFSILNGITYFGRKNLQEHASKMYCMIFDLDGITDDTLNIFLSSAFYANLYPIPNYIALSGHGVHLYYLFEYPIPLYPNIKMQLKAFKYALIKKLWNEDTSIDEKKQYQGINQGFRVIGGKTKIDGVRVRAFRINEHPFTLEQLNQYIPKESRVDESKLYKECKMSLEEAKKKFPRWYEDKVINKQPRRYWTCKEDLYRWWIEKIKEGATFHHRYFCIMCLAIYGAKCGVPFEKVKADAEDLMPFLNSINKDEPFTESDCLSALECYDTRYCTFPIDDIKNISGIDIKKNKRNGRKQELHLKLARSNKQILKEAGEMRKEGRPKGTGTKEQLVIEYLKEHENDNISHIANALGVSRNTVYKYKKMLEREV